MTRLAKWWLRRHGFVVLTAAAKDSMDTELAVYRSARIQHKASRWPARWSGYDVCVRLMPGARELPG